MDWKMAGKQRLSRRRFLGAVGATSGLAGLVVAGCGGGGAKAPTPSGARGTAQPPGVRTATAAPSSTGAGPLSARHGETLRYTGFVASDGAFDPHKAQTGTFVGQQSLVFSRLVTYANQATGEIVRDLAQAYEQPDKNTFLFHLDPAARWHDREPLNGRPVRGEDIVYSIERQRDGDASFARKARWQNVEKLEVTGPGTVRITLKTPLANMLEAFADVNEFVVAPELSIEGRDIPVDLQIGTGPFRWVEWQEGRFASVARNPSWFGAEQRPFLDGLDITQPKDASEIEAGLRTKRLDVAFVGRPQAEALRQSVPELTLSTAGRALWFGMRFNTRQAPYNDIRVRQALSIAIDRRAMVERFFAGSGAPSPWVSWPLSRWALPEDQLVKLAGYRQGAAGREQDVREARALLEAARGAGVAIPEELALFVVDDAEAGLRLGSVMAEQLLENLGLTVKVVPVVIGELIDRILKNDAPWAAGPDTGWLDLDDWLHPYFHSAGTKNTFSFRDPAFDRLIESQRTEFDAERRQQIGWEAQRQLMALAAGVNFVSERVVALSYPYVKNFPFDAVDGFQDRFADTWIDRSDPSYRGRGVSVPAPAPEPAR